MSNMIFKRTSVRNYTKEPLTENQIDLLLKAGMAAPSAMNVQPWEFIVVQNSENLDKIMAIHPYSSMLKEASLAIIVCADTEKGGEGIAPKKYWIQDCSAVSENILLEATDLGLGGVWLGTYPKEEVYKPIAKAFNLPENIIPVTILSIGHPTGNVNPKDKFDKNKIHYEKW